MDWNLVSKLCSIKLATTEFTISADRFGSGTGKMNLNYPGLRNLVHLKVIVKQVNHLPQVTRARVGESGSRLPPSP